MSQHIQTRTAVAALTAEPGQQAGTVAVAALVSDLNLQAGNQAPDDVLLLPAGQFQARDGRPGAATATGFWQLDAAAGQHLIAAASRAVGDFVIDYEHQTLNSQANGQPAPAAGWFKDLEWRDSGLWAKVRWTQAAATAIAAGEYRYISPVFHFSQDGRVIAILMAALTNFPALDGHSDLASRAAARFSLDNTSRTAALGARLGNLIKRLMKEKGVSTEQLADAAGIEPGTVSQILRGDIDTPPEKRLKGFARVLDVSLDTLTAALTTNPEALMNEKQLAALRTKLGLEADADADAINAAVAALTDKAEAGDEAVAALTASTAEVATLKAQLDTPDPDKWVPKAVYAEALKASHTAAAYSDQAALSALIKDGMADGRIPGQATADWLQAQGLAACKTYLDAAPPIAALGRTQTGGKAPDADDKGKTRKDALSEADIAVCKQMGLDPADYAKHLETAQ